MIIDPEKLDSESCYKLLIGSVVPRPIAWISTVSSEGVHNLAPFSFFTVASRNPPMLCVSVGPRSDGATPVKDTLANIQRTGELVINVVSLPLASAMYESSKTHPPEVDEFEVTGLAPASCEAVIAPRVAEALISMECRLERAIPLGSDHLVVARMVLFHIRDDLYENGRVNVGRLQPLGRLAGNYTKIETIFGLPV